MAGSEKGRDERRRAALAAVAPGTALRDGLERILRGNTGALIVLGYDAAVEALCTGGFQFEVDFSATKLRELAKMDGAIVLSNGARHIVRAAVHLVPDPTIPTDESGTRHRTAERVARQTGHPVISVSKSMRIIALYMDCTRYVLEGSAAVLSRANQALATLERYKARFDEVSRKLSALEIEDLATVRDVSVVVQRLEMVRRIADEIEGCVVELGTDGRLLALQLDELAAGVGAERELLVRDYLPSAAGLDASRPSGRSAAAGKTSLQASTVLPELDQLTETDLVDLTTVAAVLGLGGPDMLDRPLSPKGYRLLAKVPRLPSGVIEQLVDRFGGLQKLLAASVDELKSIGGVGEGPAHSVREGLSRLAESSILERYV